MNASPFQTASALPAGFWFGRRSYLICAMCAPRHRPATVKPSTCRHSHCKGWQQQRAQIRANRLRELAALALLGLAALSPSLDLFA